ncbi:hypothetical protein I5N20_10210 [Serratia marcescens]|jgi:uncharacterized protein YaaQ|nr:hypothetical protein [Serratia marcescens]
MNEQQVNALIAALQEETKAKQEQTVALTRLAESNESLVAVLVDAFSNDMGDVDIIKNDETQNYLSNRG